MLKTYQFKTQCKGDVLSSKTANIILPGLVTKHRWTPLRVAYKQNKFKCMDVGWTTHITKFEYYFVCTCKGVHQCFVYVCSFITISFGGTD